MGRSKSLFGEARKLCGLSLFLAGEVFRARRGDRNAQDFLTEIYLASLFRKDALPIRELLDIVPEAKNSSFQIPFHFLPHVASSFDDQESLLSTVEVTHLCTLLGALKPQRIFEFGTYRGGTSYLFTQILPETEVFTLDLNLERVRRPEIKQAMNNGRIKAFTGDSTRFDFSQFDKKFDFIFIDGGHDEKTVRSDTQNALRLIAPGGLVLWHDYKFSSPDVMKVLNGFGRDLPLRRIRETSFAALRRFDQT